MHPGGIVYPLKLGKEEVIETFVNARLLRKTIFCWVFFAFAFIFNFSIFLQRPEDKASLFLALFTLIQGLRFFSTEAMIYRYLPDETNLKAHFNLRLMITTTLLGFIMKMEALLGELS